MNKRREIKSVSDMRTGRIDDAMNRYGLGRNSIRELAKAARAEIRVGKALLFNFNRIDEYLDGISE